MKKIIIILYMLLFSSLSLAEIHSLKNLITTPETSKVLDESFYDDEEGDLFSGSTFKELLEDASENNISLVIAQGTYVDETGKTWTQTYEAIGLLRHLFGSNFITPETNRYQEGAQFAKKDPKSREPFNDTINFYLINEDGGGTLLGTDWDLHVDPTTEIAIVLKNNILATFDEGIIEEYKKLALNFIEQAEQEDNPDLKNVHYRHAMDHFKILETQNKNLQVKADTQFKLWQMYYEGQGVVAPDVEKALTYLKQTAQQDANLDVKAQALFKLATLYNKGDRVKKIKKDLKRAIEYFKQAGQQDADLDIKAQALFELGNIYGGGPKAIHDKKIAFDYFNKAEQQDANPEIKAKAQYQVGFMYNYGQGVEQNEEKAFEYFVKAEQQNVNLWAKEAAIGELKKMPDKMYALANKILEENTMQALHYFQLAEQQRYDDIIKFLAQYKIAHIYFHGIGIEKNYEKAFEYFIKVEQQNMLPTPKVIAQYYIGLMYLDGLGIPQDYQKALEYLSKAEGQNVNLLAKAEAQARLGEIYWKGLGIPRDTQKALSYLRQAEQQSESTSAQDYAKKILQEIEEKKRELEEPKIPEAKKPRLEKEERE